MGRDGETVRMRSELGEFAGVGADGGLDGRGPQLRLGSGQVVADVLGQILRGDLSAADRRVLLPPLEVGRRPWRTSSVAARSPGRGTRPRTPADRAARRPELSDRRPRARSARPDRGDRQRAEQRRTPPVSGRRAPPARARGCQAARSCPRREPQFRTGPAGRCSRRGRGGQRRRAGRSRRAPARPRSTPDCSR